MDSLFDLTGNVALVTGARRGLGEGFARVLAKAGADVALTSRHPDSLARIKNEIESMGRRAVGVALDVRNKESIKAAVSEVESSLGRIDVLVNNAGCNVRKPALDVTWEDWNLILETNLRGPFFVAQAVAPGMIRRGYGRIINIGSVTSVAGTLPNAPRNTMPTRPINNWDMAAYKRVGFLERYSFEFGAQSYNVFNHAQYTPGTVNNINQTSNVSTYINFQTVGNGFFGLPGKVFLNNGRTMQLSLKFLF